MKVEDIKKMSLDELKEFLKDSTNCTMVQTHGGLLTFTNEIAKRYKDNPYHYKHYNGNPDLGIIVYKGNKEYRAFPVTELFYTDDDLLLNTGYRGACVVVDEELLLKLIESIKNDCSSYFKTSLKALFEK